MRVERTARLMCPLSACALALALAAYSAGVAGAILLLLFGFPILVGGLVAYFEYGWRRAAVAGIATFALMLALGALNGALGDRTNGGGTPPPAATR
jgi:hypothetical protein